MREVAVKVWCDRHAGMLDERVPGTGRVVQLDGAGARSIDLCDECAAELLDPLRALLDEHGVSATASGMAANHASATAAGRRLGRPAKSGRPWQCPRCPADYASSSSLGRHTVKAHGSTAEPVVPNVFGTRCPLCQEPLDSGRERHAQREHGVANLSQVFVQARQAGDPHGVLTELGMPL